MTSWRRTMSVLVMIEAAVPLAAFCLAYGVAWVDDPPVIRLTEDVNEIPIWLGPAPPLTDWNWSRMSPVFWFSYLGFLAFGTTCAALWARRRVSLPPIRRDWLPTTVILSLVILAGSLLLFDGKYLLGGGCAWGVMLLAGTTAAIVPWGTRGHLLHIILVAPICTAMAIIGVQNWLHYSPWYGAKTVPAVLMPALLLGAFPSALRLLAAAANCLRFRSGVSSAV
jgi:hypothetical protein